jgi:GAF domain-containing protein
VIRKQVLGHLMLTSSREGAFGEGKLQDFLVILAALAAIALAHVSINAVSRQRAAEMEALWTVAQAAAAQSDLREFADTLTEQVRSVIGAELCTLSIWETSPEGERRLCCQGSEPADALLPGQTLGQSPSGCIGCDNLSQQAAERGEAAMGIGIPNPTFGDCRWRAFAGQSGVHSVLASPLGLGDEFLGALTVYRIGNIPFLPSQVQLLATFGMLATAAVQKLAPPAEPASV